VRFETVVHPKEGMELHLEVAIIPHRDVNHHIEYLILAGIDITARKHAEAEIQTLIDTIPQLVWTRRPDGSHDSCNQRWCDYTGQNTEQAQGEGWLQCIHPEDRQRVRSAWQRAVQTGGVYEIESRLRSCTTGEYRWFLTRALPVRDETGQILKWFGTCTDIDEQKRAERFCQNRNTNLGIESDFCYPSPGKKREREAEIDELPLLRSVHHQKASEENRAWLCNLLLLSMPTDL
jgi:PAS domain S-box-containing protein